MEHGTVARSRRARGWALHPSRGDRAGKTGPDSTRPRARRPSRGSTADSDLVTRPPGNPGCHSPGKDSSGPGQPAIGSACDEHAVVRAAFDSGGFRADQHLPAPCDDIPAGADLRPSDRWEYLPAQSSGGELSAARAELLACGSELLVAQLLPSGSELFIAWLRSVGPDLLATGAEFLPARPELPRLVFRRLQRAFQLLVASGRV